MKKKRIIRDQFMTEQEIKGSETAIGKTAPREMGVILKSGTDGREARMTGGIMRNGAHHLLRQDAG
jgi:hypothetical protein